MIEGWLEAEYALWQADKLPAVGCGGVRGSVLYADEHGRVRQ
ncbi:hypothetical protein [Butyricimonas virosa]